MASNTQLALLTGVSCAWLLAGCAADSHTKAQFGHGSGAYDVDIEGSSSGSSSAGWFEFAFESVPRTNFGGGVRVGRMASDKDLDAIQADAEPGTTQAGDGECFFHGTYEVAEDSNGMPLRLGLMIRDFGLEDATSGQSHEWGTFGPRFEFAPMVLCSQIGIAAWGFSSLPGPGYGITKVQESVGGREWDASALFLDLSLGLRAEFKNVIAEPAGCRHHSGAFHESDPAVGQFNRQVDTACSGKAFSAGMIS